MISWNNEILKEKVLEFVRAAEKYYDKDLEGCLPNVSINKRLKRVLGRFGHRTVDGQVIPTRLEFSSSIFNNYNDEFIESLIGHEVAHFVTIVLFGEAHGHDKVFREVCTMLSKETGKRVQMYSRAKIDANDLRYTREQSIDIAKENYKKRVKESRYIVSCKECKNAIFYKRANKDSFQRWVLGKRCGNLEHKDSLVCYDLKTKIKYENCNGVVVESKMTNSDVAKCDKIVTDRM